MPFYKVIWLRKLFLFSRNNLISFRKEQVFALHANDVSVSDSFDRGHHFQVQWIAKSTSSFPFLTLFKIYYFRKKK